MGALRTRYEIHRLTSWLLSRVRTLLREHRFIQPLISNDAALISDVIPAGNCVGQFPLNKWLIFVAWTACILVFGAVTTRYLTTKDPNRSSFPPFRRLLSRLLKETRILFADRCGFRIFTGLSDFKFRNFKYVTRWVDKFQTCNTKIRPRRRSLGKTRREEIEFSFHYVGLRFGKRAHVSRRSIDRRIIEPTVPCNIVSRAEQRRHQEETGPELGRRSARAFRFQAYFITKPQFRRGLRSRRKQKKKTKRKGRNKKEVEENAVPCTRLPAVRDLAPFADFSTLSVAYVRIFSLLRFVSPFTNRLSFYDRVRKFAAWFLRPCEPQL